MSQPDRIVIGNVDSSFVQPARAWLTKVGNEDVLNILEEYLGKNVYITIEVIE